MEDKAKGGIEPEQIAIPPFKVVWPSDLQMKGADVAPNADASGSGSGGTEGSQPAWVSDKDAGRRIRQSFLLSGADNALQAVNCDERRLEVEPLRAERQHGRDGALSHAKVLSCHLCSEEGSIEAPGEGGGGGNGSDSDDDTRADRLQGGSTGGGGGEAGGGGGEA